MYVRNIFPGNSISLQTYLVAEPWAHLTLKLLHSTLSLACVICLQTLLTGSPARQLDTLCQKLRLASFAPSTLRTRRTQWKKYFEFCDKFSIRPLPANEKTVCRFIAFISPLMKFSSMQNYVASLSSLASLHHFNELTTTLYNSL